MSITQALSNATSGLTAASQRAGVTSNNIANALTEGYSRRDVSLSERVTGGVGAGVSVTGVSRSNDPAILHERRTADSELSFEDSIASALARVSSLIGDAEDPRALFQKYANFESSLRSLADAPDSAAALSGVFDAATDIIATFNRLSGSFQQIRSGADAEIAERVVVVNDSLRQVEDLNRAITRGSGAGTDVSALLDQRQRLVDQINENLPVQEVPRSGGAIDLVTNEGVFLLAGTARAIHFDASPVITASSVFNGGAGALSGISVDGIDITPGGASPQAPREGALAGLFSVRDAVVPAAAQQLDALALDLGERFSDPVLDPTLGPNAPGLFTDAGGLAVSGNIVGLASRLAINPAVNPNTGGALYRLRDGIGAAQPGAVGNDTLLRSAIAALNEPRPTHPLLGASGNLTAAEAVAHLTSVVGAARASAETRKDSANAFATSLREAESAANGVDTDRELQQLLSIEQAYAANARVIQTVDQLLQRLLEI